MGVEGSLLKGMVGELAAVISGNTSEVQTTAVATKHKKAATENKHFDFKATRLQKQHQTVQSPKTGEGRSKTTDAGSAPSGHSDDLGDF